MQGTLRILRSSLQAVATTPVQSLLGAGPGCGTSQAISPLVIRHLRQYHDIIGHVHTAGNPGRGELDDRQEIIYPAVMRTLLELGYNGYVGQEFIPVRDPVAGLTQAVSLCDVA